MTRLPAPASIVRLGLLAVAPSAMAAPEVAARAPQPLDPTLGLSAKSWLLIAVGLVAAAVGSMLMLREARAARRREQELARDREALSDAYNRAEAKSAQLQATLAGMSDGVMMLDGDLRLVEWNDNFPEFTGVPREILRVGVSMEEMLRAQALAGEFGAVEVEAEVQRRITLLRSYRGGEPYERVRPNGRVLELRRRPLPGGGFVTLYSDVTARKAAEATQRETRRLAEAAIEQRAQFVAMASHEIRGLVNAVMSSFTLLDQSGLTDHQRALAATGRQAGSELLGLISDILDLARIDAGHPALRPADFEVAALLESVREMFCGPAAARGIVLNVSIAPDVPSHLYADAQRLRQILINFAGNACKYSRPGPVTLRAQMQASDGGEALRLSVRDQGPRIPEQQAALLFVPFARLDYAREIGAPGTGLGLAICERVTRLMGGRIGLAPSSSRHDEQGGNEFWVTIPLQSADDTALERAAIMAGAHRRARRANVLLVEDVPSNRVLTAALLRRAGHRVDVAETGAEAIGLVQARPYDIVFMDLVMPLMDGYEAARRVRALPGPEGRVPIIALTASDDEEKPAALADAGINGLLAKPVHRDELSDALDATVWKTRRRPAPTRPATPASDLLIDAARLQDLQRDLPHGMFDDLLEQCLTDIRGRLRLLRQALAGGEIDSAGRAAHALAGTASGYALAGLERRMRSVMRAANAGDLAAAAAELAEVDGELERSAALVRSLLQAQAAA
jgi:signal transduction histidine kinase/CheY-like chemotaxis protein